MEEKERNHICRRNECNCEIRLIRNLAKTPSSSGWVGRALVKSLMFIFVAGILLHNTIDMKKRFKGRDIVSNKALGVEKTIKDGYEATYGILKNFYGRLYENLSAR